MCWQVDKWRSPRGKFVLLPTEHQETGRSLSSCGAAMSYMYMRVCMLDTELTPDWFWMPKLPAVKSRTLACHPAHLTLCVQACCYPINLSLTLFLSRSLSSCSGWRKHPLLRGCQGAAVLLLPRRVQVVHAPARFGHAAQESRRRQRMRGGSILQSPGHEGTDWAHLLQGSSQGKLTFLNVYLLL